MTKNRSSAPTSCPWPCHTTRSPRTFPHNFTKSKNLLSQLSVRACTHYVQALCFCFSNPFKKLAEKTQSQKKAVSNGNRLIHAKKLCTKTTFHTPHKSSQNNLPGPGIISHKPPPQFELSKTNNMVTIHIRENRKFSPKTAAKLPHPPMDMHCVKKNTKSELLPKFNIFLISSSKFLKQLARAGLGHALVLTICPRTPSAKLIEFERTFSHLVGRDLVPELAHHEHSWSTSSN